MHGKRRKYIIREDWRRGGEGREVGGEKRRKKGGEEEEHKRRGVEGEEGK